METIGKRLRTARESRELSIEDVAHETRIQSIYIRGLENDDYSNFASTTYAKSFLTLYSRFLGVNAEEALLQFAGGDSISLSGQGYLEAVTDQIQPKGSSPSRSYHSTRTSAPKRESNPSSPGLAPIFLGLVLLLLVIAIPTMWYVGKDAASIEEAGSNLEELAKNAKLTKANPAGQSPDSVAVPDGPKVEGELAAGPSPSKIKPLTKPLPPTFPRTEVEGSASKPETETAGPPIAIPVARPIGDPPKLAEDPEKVSEPVPTPAPPAGVEPIRAKPLLARPVVIPAEGDPEGESETVEENEGTGEEPVAKPREDGNLFPRPE